MAGKNVETNELYVAHADHRQWLDSDSAVIEKINWIVPDDYVFPANCTVKFRYRQKDIPVTLEVDGDRAVVRYPQKVQRSLQGRKLFFMMEIFALAEE